MAQTNPFDTSNTSNPFNAATFQARERQVDRPTETAAGHSRPSTSARPAYTPSAGSIASGPDTFAVGTRKLIPVSFPFVCGSTSPTAFAAPVLDGTTTDTGEILRAMEAIDALTRALREGRRAAETREGKATAP